jgi:antitoxin HicB
MKKVKIADYPFIIRHLTTEEGGGYLIEFPDLPGCMSDGESIEEAVQNGGDAAACWIAAAKEIGREIPMPGSLEIYPSTADCKSKNGRSQLKYDCNCNSV